MDNLLKAFYAILLTGHATVIFTFWIAVILIIASGILLSVRWRRIRYFVYALLLSVASYFGMSYLLYS